MNCLLAGLLSGTNKGMNTNQFNKEFLRVVEADLRYLRDEWGNDIDDDSLRRNTPVLHRLLNEDHLGQAWRMVGIQKEPKILTPLNATAVPI